MWRSRVGTWVMLLVSAALGCDAAERSEHGTDARTHLQARPDLHPQQLTADGVPLSRIALENLEPGTSSWQLEQPARGHEVEGYASQVSARAGDRVRLHVHVSAPHEVHYELYRMGYYQGLGGRFVTSAPARPVMPQPSCPADARTGLVECRWAASFELSIEPAWLTGQYFFKLIRDDGFESYVPLVVREPEPHAKVLVQSAVTTWQAYNLYGGSSLYRNELPPELGFKRKHADAVSFNRPYTCQDLNSPQCLPGAGDFDLGERWLGRYLEQLGVEVAYVTNLEVDREGDPKLLQDRSLYIAVGHDEYWPIGERAALDDARDRGLSLLFLSANTGYWRVRLAADSSGTARRTIVCYKDGRDPVQDASDTTVEFRDDPKSRPEQSLIGVMYDDDASRTYLDAFAPIVQQADHWIWAGTGVRDGDALSHIVGYEWDHAFDNASAPPRRELIAHGEQFNVHGQSLPADMSLYYPTDHSFVFGGGSIYWARGLAHPVYRDARVARVLVNLLQRAGVKVTPLDDPEDGAAPPAADAPALEVVVGPDASGQSPLRAPVGLALAPDGRLFVADNQLHAVLEIAADGGVQTLAGCGKAGNADGVGSAACLRSPTGLVRLGDGSLIVSDTGNARLRKIFPDGRVETIAGSGKPGSVDADDPLAAQLSDPRGLALAADGSVLIADSATSFLRKLDATGLHTLAESYHPTGIALAPGGSLYVISTRGAMIQRYDGSNKSVVVGRDSQFGDADGPADEARLRPADGIALDGERVVFTDSANHKLRVWDPASGQVQTLAGDGSARSLQMPRGVVVDERGYLVADTGNHRIVRVPRP